MSGASSRRGGPSREEIETLCILHAVSARGCSVADLPARFGISSALESALLGALDPLVARGWITVEGGRVSRTQAGSDRLVGRLGELGVAFRA